MKAKPLNLTIRDRDSVIYDGEVNTLSSVNETGKFDVLRKHANFISLIKDYIIVRELTGEEKKYEIGSGIMKVLENDIFIYLGLK